jgi:hypothetical protein
MTTRYTKGSSGSDDFDHCAIEHLQSVPSVVAFSRRNTSVAESNERSIELETRQAYLKECVDIVASSQKLQTNYRELLCSVFGN